MHPVILLLLSSITTDLVWLLIFTRFLDHTQRRTTLGRTPLNEWSVRRRDLYLTTHNNHNRQTSMTPTCWGFFTLFANGSKRRGKIELSVLLGHDMTLLQCVLLPEFLLVDSLDQYTVPKCQKQNTQWGSVALQKSRFLIHTAVETLELAW